MAPHALKVTTRSAAEGRVGGAAGGGAAVGGVVGVTVGGASWPAGVEIPVGLAAATGPVEPSDVVGTGSESVDTGVGAVGEADSGEAGAEAEVADGRAVGEPGVAA